MNPLINANLGIIHTDICGSLRHMSRQGASYFITFTDDYSRYGYIYLLKHKHEVFETFKVFKNEVENQLGKTIKAIRSDRGGEYISQEFKDYLKVNGIVQQLTPPYTPQHNGVSKRRNRTLLGMVRSMMNLTTLPLSFWDYALESATRILNMVPTKKVDKTPYELWYGKVPNLSYLKVWGCEALVKRDTPDKLEQRSIKCIFIGYPKETMGYYFYFPPENKIVVARYAEFFEKRLISQEISGRAVDLEEIQEEEDTTPSEITSNIPQEVEGFEPPQEEVIPIRRSERTRRAPNRLCLNVEVEEHSLGDLNEPTSYKAAMLDSESNKWIDAMNAEIQSMMDNMVWVLVDLPPGCKTVGSKWLFKKKTDMDGIVHVYKARLVAKGYTQLYGVDYEETFSPVADIRAIRILISIAAYYDYEIWQMDVKTAFLNGYLDEDIYMVQPEGFVNRNHPRKASGSNVTFLILYVDDIIIMGNHIPSLQSVKDYLGKCFAMKDLGEAAFILGIKIYRDRSKRLIGLCQNAYMDKILKRYKMDNSKRGHIPMQECLDLNKMQGASTPEELKSWMLMKTVMGFFKIHEVQYSTVVAKLRKVFRNTDRMKFIKEDLYVITVAVRGGQIYEFRGYKEFAGSKSLPYGEGYGDLSTRVDFDNFTLVWTSFETAVEAEELQESTLKNDDERELGLHLLGFSKVLEEVCTLLTPHILCQYVYELCVKFDSLETSAGQDVMSSEETSNLLLCGATEVVMRKCFYLLGITPICKT
ncbi:retrotransposon protein, putative, ty1-copia subclass [Tanacetum coccineum]|uniref:Retrotransposon protein, putative, ty1-copia subclass n=1 Tax=Tanacetum coccineum TaxID=301880 RepID=A0ABQ5EIY7_9ASTR